MLEYARIFSVIVVHIIRMIIYSKLYNHPVHNLFSMEEVVSSFNDLLSELKTKKKKGEYLDCDIFNETDINILKNLKKSKELVICKSDKGRGVVILYRNTYVEKMNLILNDFQSFEKQTFLQFPKHALKN